MTFNSDQYNIVSKNVQIPPPVLRTTSPEFRGGFWTRMFDSLPEFGEGWGGVKNHYLMCLSLIVFVLFSLAAPLAAQGVTDDEVNAIAKKMFCPVCENIPLDTCETVACQQWREEIRTQLANGSTEQDVINDFVRRFGDRVVGTPQDPTLRALSLVTPWIIAALAAIVALWTVLRWRGGTSASVRLPVMAGEKDEEYYRARIEQDLQARR